jgi:hypothetical protein
MDKQQNRAASFPVIIGGKESTKRLIAGSLKLEVLKIQ